jgi:hypothetical protein
MQINKKKILVADFQRMDTLSYVDPCKYCIKLLRSIWLLDIGEAVVLLGEIKSDGITIILLFKLR